MNTKTKWIIATAVTGIITLGLYQKNSYRSDRNLGYGRQMSTMEGLHANEISPQKTSDLPNIDVPSKSLLDDDKGHVPRSLVEEDLLNDVETSPLQERQYEEAIARFKARLRDVTSSSLQKEQEELSKIVEDSEKMALHEPRETIFVDQFGNRWIKKIFDGDVVRYDFLPVS